VLSTATVDARDASAQRIPRIVVCDPPRDLPANGTRVEQGQPFGEVESTKSVSDLYAPVSGTIVERNETLESQPELVNSDPYGQGWMVVIEADEDAQTGALLSAADYDKLIESS
jgi:glycine cleavage system H protein